MNQNNTLYKAYLEKKKENKLREKTLKKYNISDSDKTIIISKNTNKILLFIWEVIGKLFKLIFIITIVILVTIGTTVILNEQLRNYILNFL